MNEHDQKNLKRFEELAERARQSCIYTYSSFHSAETAALAYEVAEENEITMWGGTENAERVVVRFGDPKRSHMKKTIRYAFSTPDLNRKSLQII